MNTWRRIERGETKTLLQLDRDINPASLITAEFPSPWEVCAHIYLPSSTLLLYPFQLIHQILHFLWSAIPRLCCHHSTHSQDISTEYYVPSCFHTPPPASPVRIKIISKSGNCTKKAKGGIK